jgi:hypothetical protein
MLIPFFIQKLELLFQKLIFNFPQPFFKVQCVLSINLFNEKIFIFLWFWICLVSAFNVIDLFSWLYTLVINSHERYNYVKRRINAIKSNAKDSDLSSMYLSDAEDRRLFKKFVNNYLREDGVLALRLLSRNSQDLIVSEVVTNLYNLYKKQCKQQKNYSRQQGKSVDVNDVNETVVNSNGSAAAENLSDLSQNNHEDDDNESPKNHKKVHNSLHNTVMLSKKSVPYEPTSTQI